MINKNDFNGKMQAQFFSMVKDGGMQVHICPDVMTPVSDRWVVTAYGNGNTYGLMTQRGDLRSLTIMSAMTLCSKNGVSDVTVNGLSEMKQDVIYRITQ